VARSLKNKKTMTIGVVITDINRIFFPQVIKGIQDCAVKFGYNLTFCNTSDEFETEMKFVQMLESSWVDGIILDSVANTGNTGYFKYLSQMGNKKKIIPVVSLERRMENFNIGSVVVDNLQGGSMAAKHLIDCGCKSIIHIAGPLNSCVAHDRLTGYRAELEKNGMDTGGDRVIKGDYSPLSGHFAMKQALSDGIEADGVFAANDQMAIGALKAIKENGLSVPEDMKVIGFDNTFVASIVEPALSTINVPKYRMGDAAVEMLVRRIENPSGEASCSELPINLIVRQSTSLKGDKSWDLYGW